MNSEAVIIEAHFIVVEIQEKDEKYSINCYNIYKIMKNKEGGGN